MMTYKEIAKAALKKRKPFHNFEVIRERLAELIDKGYSTYAGEMEELVRGYCLFQAQRRDKRNTARNIAVLRKRK